MDNRKDHAQGDRHPCSSNQELTAEAAQWIRENREGLEALNKFTEKNGLFAVAFKILPDPQKP